MEVKSLTEVIAKLEDLFHAFNERFFEGELHTPVITVNPDMTRGAYGWCTAYKAWKNRADENYEINICAEYLSRPFLEVCGTMLHEMIHLFNLQNDIQDCSRGNTYHNKKFKVAAEEHGLTVELDGKYGWTKTSLTEETVEWLKDEYGELDPFTMYREGRGIFTGKGKAKKKSSSRKYVCPCCGTIIRATKEVNVVCVGIATKNLYVRVIMMTMTEKLKLMKESEERNEQRIREFLRQQKGQ